MSRYLTPCSLDPITCRLSLPFPPGLQPLFQLFWPACSVPPGVGVPSRGGGRDQILFFFEFYLPKTNGKFIPYLQNNKVL